MFPPLRFRSDNTNGYTQVQLDELNRELEYKTREAAKNGELDLCNYFAVRAFDDAFAETVYFQNLQNTC